MSRAKVTKIMDGDTFKVSGGKTIRLANVWAPELRAKGGTKAKHDLSDLLGKKTVSINVVGKSYGRLVANVKLGTKSVNQVMRNKGYKNKSR